MNGLTIDGVTFSLDECLISDLTENSEILTGEKSGRRQDYDMHIEYGGTFYNYSFVINKGTVTKERWDQLHDILTDPICDHDITMPHNQTDITFRAYISRTSRKLLDIKNGYEWGNITVEFIAMRPHRRA